MIEAFTAAALTPKRYRARNTRTGLFYGASGLFTEPLETAAPLFETEGLVVRYRFLNVELVHLSAETAMSYRYFSLDPSAPLAGQLRTLLKQLKITQTREDALVARLSGYQCVRHCWIKKGSRFVYVVIQQDGSPVFSEATVNRRGTVKATYPVRISGQDLGFSAPQ